MEKSYFSKAAGFYRSSQQKCSVKKGVLRKVCKIHRKTTVSETLF